MTVCSHCGGTGTEPALFSSEVTVLDSGTVVGALHFETFWRLYPRKQSKVVAEKSWTRMTTTERMTAIDALADHIVMWNREGRGTRLIPHAATWLNQRRWEDDLSGYVDDSQPRRVMPGRTGIEAALANRSQRAIGAGS